MKKIRSFLTHMRLVPLFIAAHFGHHVLTALIAPLLPMIRAEFQLSYGQAGLVVSAFTLSYGIGQLPAGWLADRTGPKLLIAISIAGVAAAGVLVGLSQSFFMIIVFLIVMGLAGGGYHPSASPLISASVEPRYWGKALGLHVIGGSTSYFLAPLIGVGLAAAWGWRGAFVGLGIPVFVFGIVVFLMLRKVRLEESPPAAAAESRPEQASRRLLVGRLVIFLIMTIVARVIVGSIIAFVPLYMVDHFQVDEKTAAAFLAIIYSTGFWAAPLGGHISDRIGTLRLLVILGVLTGPMLFFINIVPFGLGFAVYLLVFGMLMFMRMPSAEAFLMTHIPARLRSTIMGLYFFAAMEGSGILTPILGSLIDRYGFYPCFTVSGAIVAVVTIACAVALFVMKRAGIGGPVDLDRGATS